MVTTRPDICFAVGRLTRHFQDPSVDALKVAINLARYVYWTRTEVLTFKFQNVYDNLTVYVDADYGKNLEKRSTTGYLGFFHGNLVEYFSKK
jgi:hypothetical protein